VTKSYAGLLLLRPGPGGGGNVTTALLRPECGIGGTVQGVVRRDSYGSTTTIESELVLSVAPFLSLTYTVCVPRPDVSVQVFAAA
jgi:hypothetical protein